MHSTSRHTQPQPRRDLPSAPLDHHHLTSSSSSSSYLPPIVLPYPSSSSSYLHRPDERRPNHSRHTQQHPQPRHLGDQLHLPTSSKPDLSPEMFPNQNGTSPSAAGRNSIDDSMPSASDFVKKLYKMLEDQSIASVVSWGPQGDCFIVKDMNEFTKTILPRLFKHSNFASFVRQLNKYDFHKVKNSDDNQFGEQSWTFRHKNFHADRREDLENIKRKVPAGRKPTASSSTLPPVNLSSTTSSQLPPHSTTQPLSSSSSSSHHHRDYPHNNRRDSQSRHHSPSPYGGGGGPPSPGGYEYPYDSHDSGYERHARGGHGHGHGHGHSSHRHHHHHSPTSASAPYEQLHTQVQTLQSQLSGLSASTSALSTQLRALAEGQQGLGREVEGVRGEIADVRRREGEIREELRRAAGVGGAGGAGGAALAVSAELTQLGRQTTKLTQESDNMGRRVGELERGYKNLLGEVGVLQRGILGAAAATLGGGQCLEDILKADPMTGVDPSTPGTNYWGARGLVGGWLEGSGSGSGQQGKAPNAPAASAAASSANNANANVNAASGTTGRTRASGAVDECPGNSHRGTSDPDGSSSEQAPSSSHPTFPGSFASASTSTAGCGDDSRNNPFLPIHVSPDAARASLVQLNELSRRADERKFVFNGQAISGGGGSWQQQQQQQTPDQSSSSSSQSSQQQQTTQTSSQQVWEEAVSAGLFGDGAGFSFDGTSGAMRWNGGTSASLETGRAQGAPSEARASEALTSHEGLEVYTVGHLVPRDQLQRLDSSAAQWTFGDFGQASGQQQQPYPASAPNGRGGDGQGSPELGGFQDGSSSSRSLSSLVSSAPTIMPSALNTSIAASSVSSASSSATSRNTTSANPKVFTRHRGRPKLRVRRSTFVPAWAVPPRVLLVDDDAVSRMLGSKFLQVFGCTIDVAVDGVGAVNKMNLEKYDLVLMDIVMPKLDGISATSLIRKFDPMTPIISMTSNSKPSEIMTYYSSGMNDILPKPFSKEGMLEMLEKHLTHLRTIQQMSRGIPRSVGIPPLSEQAFQSQATNRLTGPSSSPSTSPSTGLVASGPSSAVNADDDPAGVGNGGIQRYEGDSGINPLAGMGLSDEQYNSMLQDMVNGDPFLMGPMTVDTSASSVVGGMMVGVGVKRGYDAEALGDDGDKGREGGGKRSRFEVIE